MTQSARSNEAVVKNRRARLRRWIDERCFKSQTYFIASTSDGEKQINQGELSGLLKTKSFGEKRARNLERQAGMPPGYLDEPDDASNLYTSGTHVSVVSSPQYTPPAARMVWPFQRVSYQRIYELKAALGQKFGADALRDIDSILDVVVTKWENTVAEKKRRG